MVWEWMIAPQACARLFYRRWSLALIHQFSGKKRKRVRDNRGIKDLEERRRNWQGNQVPGKFQPPLVNCESKIVLPESMLDKREKIADVQLTISQGLWDLKRVEEKGKRQPRLLHRGVSMAKALLICLVMMRCINSAWRFLTLSKYQLTASLGIDYVCSREETM